MGRLREGATMTTVGRTIKVAVVQMLVGVNKAENVSKAVRLIKEAASHDSQLECFNSPYGTRYFNEYSEAVPDGETCGALSRAAMESKVWLVGGSIPERDGDLLFNTSSVYSPEGRFLGKYRKITFKESETLSAGNAFLSVDVGPFRMGLGICYDLRFPEFTSIYGQVGCNLLIFPSAFNMVTGPLHWHLLQRARAVDAASFVISASPARRKGSEYEAYGHSLIIDPRGGILAEAGEDEQIIYAELDPILSQEMRRNIPTLTQKRTDLYTISSIVKHHRR